MGAMTELNLSDNGIGGHDDEPGVHALADMLKSNTTLKEFNISSNSLDEECAQILAPAIKDNGVISSLNLLLNNIGIDQAKGLVSILKEHPTLKTLCGNKGNATKLNMSSKMRGAGDAIMLVPDIIDNGAMSELTFGDKEVVTMTIEMTEADFSGKLYPCDAQIMAAFLPKCT
jgi:hypothetical protein